MTRWPRSVPMRVIVDMSEGVELREPGENEPGDEGDQNVDPHYWLSGPNAIQMVRNARPRSSGRPPGCRRLRRTRGGLHRPAGGGGRRDPRADGRDPGGAARDRHQPRRARATSSTSTGCASSARSSRTSTSPPSRARAPGRAGRHDPARGRVGDLQRVGRQPASWPRRSPRRPARSSWTSRSTPTHSGRPAREPIRSTGCCCTTLR